VPPIRLQHERVALATAERRVDLDLWFAARPGPGQSIREVPYGLAYLHLARMAPRALDVFARLDPLPAAGTADEQRAGLLARFERGYTPWVPALRAAYRALFETTAYDAVLRPPSGGDAARPLLEEARAARPGAVDLSPGLRYTPTEAAPPPRADARDERPHVGATPHVSASLRPVLPAVERLLVVDDTYADGAAIAGWWEALRAAGLPPSARLVVACPLRTTAP
jgi:hypothetical protein